MPLETHNNTLKGAYKPPKYRCWGYADGVPFTRVYRTLRAVKGLKKQQGITLFQYVILN